MQIIDFSSPSPSLERQPKSKLYLEVITATLIFIVPAIMLFILSQ